ncbi:MAG TPA: TonB-dependent receptor, partial [Candidatus Sulfomarinibacteraceae bacterium]|nr:TonB-dependent receptor [Candidatus Sulfomarinibacteraceae bacterium]
MLRRKVLSLATALVSLITSGVAVAQDATTPPPTAPPAADVVVGDAPATTPAGDQEQTEEIVVTGTRIRRKDLTTPAPVTVINRDQIVASGKVSIGDFLQALPEQGNAINTGVNNSGDGATRINLRGVGSARTLVLVNGRRWMPGGTGADDSVDLNSIPSAAVERIEVLKDGASAVYGSDAIAGVVNIITRRAGTHTDVSAYGGTSYQGDGTTYDLNLTTGTGGERGNLLFSAGYYTQRKTMANHRSFSAIPYGFDGTTGTPYTAGSGTIPAGRTLEAGATGGNALWTSLANQEAGNQSFIWDPATAPDPANGIYCGTSNGQPVCFRTYLGAGLPEAGEVGDGYNFQPDNYLVTPQERIQLFATGDLNLTTWARGFFEAAYVNRQSAQDLAPEPLVLDGEGVAVSADSIYNPFDTDVFVRRRLSEFGRRATRQDIDSFRVLTGVDGTLPDTLGPASGWFWDVNFNYGRTIGTQTNRGNLFISALADSLGPSMMVDGTPTCVASPGDPATAIDGCVPLNLFGGPGSITPDQVTGLTFTGVARGTNELTSFQVNTSGDLFPLLSERPVGLAAGYEFRTQAGEFIFDPITEKGLVTGNKGQNTKGSYDVNELYAELSIPIVSALPLVEDLEATAAIRWFDYSTFGSDYTYKFGGRWKPIRDVTVRGTYSTAFRAPSISELYQGRLDNFAGLRDP